jgi:hypothetical protein
MNRPLAPQSTPPVPVHTFKTRHPSSKKAPSRNPANSSSNIPLAPRRTPSGLGGNRSNSDTVEPEVPTWRPDRRQIRSRTILDGAETEGDDEQQVSRDGESVRTWAEQETDVRSVFSSLEEDHVKWECLSRGAGWCAPVSKDRKVSTVKQFYEAFHDVKTMALHTCRICYRKVSLNDMQAVSRDQWAAVWQEWSVPGAAQCSRCFPLGQDVRSCEDCSKAIKRGYFSQAAQLNEVIGCEHRYPEELKHLSPVEEKLIALNSCYGFITKYTATAEVRHTASYPRHVKGHITVFPSNVQELAANVLPHPLVNVMKEIHVVWQGREKPPPRDLSTLLSVRPRVVKRALAWLKRHNPLYTGIEIDEAELESWEDTEHGVPAAMYARMQHSEPSACEKVQTAHIVPATERGLEAESPIEIPELLASLETAETEGEDGGLPSDPIFEPGIEDEMEPVEQLSASGMFGLDRAAIMTDSERLRFFYAAMDSNSNQDGPNQPACGAATVRHHGALEPFVVMSRGEEFADSLDPAFFPKTFPGLFPFGRGGPARAAESTDGASRDDPGGLALTRNMTLAHWARILLQRHGGRFPHHYAFAFLVFNVEVRARNRRVSMASVKRSNFDQVERAVRALTIERLENAREELESSGKTTDEDAQLILRNLTLFGYRQPMSRESRLTMRKKIRSLIIRYGLPAIWFTVNPNDIPNPVKLRMAAYRFHEPGEAEKFLDELGRSVKRTRLAVSDPLGSAEFFHREISMFFEHYVRAGRDSVFGKVAQYFAAVETNERGALHIHGLMWLQRSQALDSVIAAKEVSQVEQSAVVDYVDSVFSQVRLGGISRPLS